MNRRAAFPKLAIVATRDEVLLLPLLLPFAFPSDSVNSNTPLTWWALPDSNR